jgi:hypothetical protein
MNEWTTLGEQVDVLHEQYKDVFVVGKNEKWKIQMEPISSLVI